MPQGCRDASCSTLSLCIRPTPCSSPTIAARRRAAAPTCRQFEALIRQHQTIFNLSFDCEPEASELWEDDDAVAALEPALARRPALRELRVQSLDCVRADVRQAGMLGHFMPDPHPLEPAAAALLGFVVGRMPALQSLDMASSYRSFNFTVQPPAWLHCLRRQLRSLELSPVQGFSPELCQLGRLTRLKLHFSHPAVVQLPAAASGLCQLQELELESSSLAYGVVELAGIIALPALRSICVHEALLVDLAWVQVGRAGAIRAHCQWHPCLMHAAPALHEQQCLRAEPLSCLPPSP